MAYEVFIMAWLMMSFMLLFSAIGKADWSLVMIMYLLGVIISLARYSDDLKNYHKKGGAKQNDTTKNNRKTTRG